jgi:hypothetical protein
MNTLNTTQIENNKAMYQALVGKDVTVMVTGERVKGTVKEFQEDQHAFILVVEHEPVNWGGDIYTTATPFARKCDNWGSLNRLEVIE